MEHAILDEDMSIASYCMNLTIGTWDCRRFQALRFPSAHGIVTCGNVLIKYASYINDIYLLEWIHSVWSPEFLTIPDEIIWSSVSSAPYE
ncbi:hypothetical protein J1N35_005278 [Gossypium stocksii]|uniref:Uncharacterized protein n=1 Tax=Gossypium stocksii TaxID=47602 RepID=A0A9D4AIU5_9ROSI|nr:hypothetical protein J1N35_005278 [Gossypium stocksii]